MEESTKTKITAITSIVMMVFMAILVCWLIFKPDNGLSKDTVEKLAVAVDKVSVAADNMNKVAIAQREWSNNLQRTMILGNQQRETDYENLYDKYGYGDKGTNTSLNDIYNRRLQQQTENNRSGHLRTGQDGTGEAPTVQGAIGESQR